MKKKKKKVNAAILIIGNEILSGRTQDKNVAFLSNWLNLNCGISVSEVRIIPDVEKIIVENNWEIDNVCSLDPDISKNLDIRLIRNIDNEKVKALVTCCEYLLSNSGRVLICNKQIKKNKIESLPPVVIILASMDQFVSDLSEGMTKLKYKYKTKFPSNITTLVVKNKLNEDNFLTYGNSAKDIYLILSDD